MKRDDRPLTGMRIISLEQYGAAPFGTMMLADLGAEVIKVENHAAGGEMGRHVVPYRDAEGDSLFYQSFSCNKQCIALNLRAPGGRDVLERLVASADGLVNNLRGDLPSKLGLDHASLATVNPKIVCVHLSAYGRDGHRAGWPGLDYVVQAEAGYMWMTGEPDSPPTRFGLSIVDYMAGQTAAIALLAGIAGAHRTGEGRDYDTSLYDVAMANLSYPATWHLTEGFEPKRAPRSGHPTLVPSELYPTRDGWIFIMTNKANFWPRLCEAMERPDWIEHPKMRDFDVRYRNRAFVMQELESVFLTRDTADWLERIQGLLPCAPVYDVADALASDVARQNRIVQRIAHPTRGEIGMVRQPILMDGEVFPREVAPRLGQDTEAVLSSLGYSAAEIDQLEDAGTVRRVSTPVGERAGE